MNRTVRDRSAIKGVQTMWLWPCIGLLGSVAQGTLFAGEMSFVTDPNSPQLRELAKPMVVDESKYGCGPLLRPGQTYYVSLDGDDGNDGRSSQRAWRHVHHGVRKLQAGDTLVVREGEYFEPHLDIKCHGEPGRPIDIMAAPRHRVIISGARPVAPLRRVPDTRFTFGAALKMDARVAVWESDALIALENAGSVARVDELPGTFCYDAQEHRLYVHFSDDGYWVVADDVLGEGRHRCDQRFHFEPELSAEIKGLQARSVDEKGANLLIAAPANSSGLALAREDGWVSYKWYGKRPARVAQFTREGPLPTHFDTVLYPQRPGDHATLAVKRVPAEDAIALRVEGRAAGPTFTDFIVLRNGSRRAPTEISGCRTDARVAYVRRDADGALARAFVENGARLECEGRVLLEASEAVPYAAVSWAGNVTSVDAATAKSLQVHRPAGSRSVEVNGKELPADQVGTGTAISLTDVVLPPKRPIPREPGAPDIAYEPPSAKKTPTSLVAYRDAPDTAGSIVVEAERYHAQGGPGRLETSSRKVNASHDAILRWDNPGHWVEWTVPAEGDYALTLRVATNHGRVLRRIAIDGKTPDKRLEAVEFGYTGGWATHEDDWQLFHIGAGLDQPVPLHLTVGQHRLRMTNLEGSLNVDYLLFSPLE